MNDEEIKTLFNVVDKLEKRIFLLEKVLSSHAKCIGEMREDKGCELTASEYISITEGEQS
jgi:hypothetical protein